jgi:uncharacterized membrane protein
MTARRTMALLALMGVLVALYLTLYKIGVLGELTCGVGKCETVNLSRYATFLGLPVAAWGLGFYVLLLAVALLGLQESFANSMGISLALVALSGWGVLFSAWLTYVELFVIHAVCMWCVVSAIIVTLFFIAAVMDMRALRAELREQAV